MNKLWKEIQSVQTANSSLEQGFRFNFRSVLDSKAVHIFDDAVALEHLTVQEWIGRGGIASLTPFVPLLPESFHGLQLPAGNQMHVIPSWVVAILQLPRKQLRFVDLL